MRDRLVELIVNAENSIYQEKPYITDTERIGKVADHLLAEGVIVPPCKVGQTVFIIDEGDECSSEPYVLGVVITAYGYDFSGFWATLHLPLGLKISARFGERMFGKTVFLTRSDAETALAERRDQ